MTNFAAHFAKCDREAEAVKRAAAIMNRVLPLGRTGHNPMVELPAFMGASQRHGARSALYAAIYPKMLAKVEACGAVEPVVQQGERRAA